MIISLKKLVPDSSLSIERLDELLEEKLSSESELVLEMEPDDEVRVLAAVVSVCSDLGIKLNLLWESEGLLQFLI